MALDNPLICGYNQIPDPFTEIHYTGTARGEQRKQAS